MLPETGQEEHLLMGQAAQQQWNLQVFHFLIHQAQHQQQLIKYNFAELIRYQLIL